jgi:hypothetical protein
MSDEKLLSVLRQAVDELWQVDYYILQTATVPTPYPLYKFFGETAVSPEKEKGQDWLSVTVERLLEAFNYDSAEFTRHAARLYFNPQIWYTPHAWDYSLPLETRFVIPAKGEIMQKILGTWVRLHTNSAVLALLTQRITILLGGQGTWTKPDLYPPTLIDCLEILLADPSEDATAICGQLAVGELGRARSGSVEEPELRRYAPEIYNRLWQKSRFNYSVFRQAMYALPNAFYDLSRPLDTVPPPDFYRDLPVNFSVALQDFYQNFAVELAEALPENNPEKAYLLKNVAVLRGASWLLLACAYLEVGGIERLPDFNRWKRTKTPASATVRICQTVRPPAEEEDDGETLGFLSHYQASTLLTVLPFALDYQDLICQALGWQHAWELVQIMEGKLPLENASSLVIAKEQAQAILDTYSLHRPSKRSIINKINDNLPHFG